MTATTPVQAAPRVGRRARSAAAGFAGGAGVAYQTLMTALIVIRPEVDPARKPISEYAIGRLGWIMIVAFMLSALSYGGLVVAAGPVLRDRLGRAGVGLLLVCVVGTLGVGLFVADPVATPMTSLSTRGLVHVISGTSAMALLPAAALSINRSLARTCPDPISARRLRREGWLPSAGFAAFVVMLAVVVPAEGWPPRVLFLTYSAWVVLLARHLTSGGTA